MLTNRAHFGGRFGFDWDASNAFAVADLVLLLVFFMVNESMQHAFYPDSCQPLSIHKICPTHWIIWIVLGREPPSLMMYAIYKYYIYIYAILVLNNSIWYSWNFSRKSPAISCHFLGRSAKVWTQEVSVGPEGDCATKALSCRVVTRQLAGGNFMAWKHQPLML